MWCDRVGKEEAINKFRELSQNWLPKSLAYWRNGFELPPKSYREAKRNLISGQRWLNEYLSANIPRKKNNHLKPTSELITEAKAMGSVSVSSLNGVCRRDPSEPHCPQTEMSSCDWSRGTGLGEDNQTQHSNTFSHGWIVGLHFKYLHALRWARVLTAFPC